MEIPEHMFGPLVRSGFLRLNNGTIIVTIQLNAILNARNYTKLTNELFDPNSFLCCISCCNILSLYCRIRDGTVLNALLAHSSSIETKYETRLRLEIIFVTLEAYIGVSSNNQLFISTINQKIILSPLQVHKDVFRCNPEAYGTLLIRLTSSRLKE